MCHGLRDVANLAWKLDLVLSGRAPDALLDTYQPERDSLVPAVISAAVGAGRYICGEETALISSLEGRRANPRSKPPFPAAVGVWGKPTCVNNVETLCNVPSIIGNGIPWYQGLAREGSEDHGTKLMGFSGKVKNPGVWELPLGIPARELFEDYAGGMRDGYTLKAWQPGGAGTGFLLPEHLDAQMFSGGIGKVGTRMGTGLALAVGEPAINAVPRRMMREAIAALAADHGAPGDVVITISIDGGEALAGKTWNPRLGILGGLSLLGTTGIVLPYSCSAWIHSIHSGIDVARASGFDHVAGSTGNTSEAAVKAHYGLEDPALLDMGDFAGGLLKYLRRNPLPWLTIAGGFAKLTKLAQGHLDLHSSRSVVDFDDLAGMIDGLGANPDLVSRLRGANTAYQALTLAEQAGLRLADLVARRARETALATLAGETRCDVLVVARDGAVIGHAGP